MEAYESPMYKKRKRRKNTLYKGHPDARALFDNWSYGEILKKNMALLVEQSPQNLLNILAHKLNKALDIEDKLPKNTRNLYEYSHIWRPFISHNAQHHEDIKDIILDKIIEILKVSAQDQPKSLPSLLQTLQRHDHPIFRRIEMWFLKEYPQVSLERIETILRDAKVIRSYNLRREYWELLAVGFPKLGRASQQSILKTISDGPDYKISKGETKEHAQAVKEDWQRNYLRPIASYLSKKESDNYQKLVKTYGDW